MKGLAWSAIPAAIGVGFVLGSTLLGQVLEPIRRMALDSLPEGDLRRVGDKVKALSRRVPSLMDDVDEAHSQLEKSRGHLMQSGRLALAACGTTEPGTRDPVQLMGFPPAFGLSPERTGMTRSPGFG